MRLAAPLLALAALLGDCAPEERPAGRLSDTVPARCDVGGKPGYFVPSSSPAVLIGCARLGASGKRVEFSTSRERIDGEPHACVHPAYRRGFYIPAFCLRAPSRFAVVDASRPRQGVRGYAFVVWGTAPASMVSVSARSTAGSARAAVFKAAESSFAVFVLELPLSAACERVTVVAKGPGVSRSDRVRPRRSACDAAVVSPP